MVARLDDVLLRRRGLFDLSGPWEGGSMDRGASIDRRAGRVCVCARLPSFRARERVCALLEPGVRARARNQPVNPSVRPSHSHTQTPTPDCPRVQSLSSPLSLQVPSGFSLRTSDTGPQSSDITGSDEPAKRVRRACVERVSSRDTGGREPREGTSPDRIAFCVSFPTGDAKNTGRSHSLASGQVVRLPPPVQ